MVEQCIISKIEEALKPEEKEIIERIIREEISKAEKTFSCALRDIERSQSIGDLTYNSLKFLNLFYDTLRIITDKTWMRLYYHLRPRGILIRDWKYYIFTRLEQFSISMLNYAMERAKNIAQNLGVESITVTVSIEVTGVSFQFSFTTKL